MASDRTCTAPSTTPDGVDLGGALPRRTTSVRRVGWRHSAVTCAAAAAAASWSCLPLDVHAQQQPQPAVLARAEVSLGRARLRTAITVRTVDAGRAELEITAGAHRVLAPVAPRGVAIRWAAVRD
ncbi:MAG: hypothetical protein IT379_11305, partial [Deltaproteobacteria bacterium]|nr:hypothetical protein [Deltaproteobacteria bacterium]